MNLNDITLDGRLLIMKHEEFMKYEEKTKHGTYLLPFAAYGTLIPRGLKFFPEHWHDEMEIVYADRGHCTYYVDFKPYEVKEGDILIIPPTVIHSFEQYENEVFRGVAAVFSLDMVNNNGVDICSTKYFMPLFNNEIILPIHLRWEDELSTGAREILLKLIRCFFEKKDGYELRIKMYLFEFFSYFFENGFYTNNKKRPSNIKSAESTKSIIAYIKEHYDERITLEDLACLTNQSVYNLSHSFKKSTGQSTLEYINSYRLSIAADYLTKTDKSVLNIAIETGFNNVSYFNRVFKNKFGMTPTQYRKVF